MLIADAIPIARAARELSGSSGKSPLQHALGDGEDFELVFAVSPADGEKLLREPPVPGLVEDRRVRRVGALAGDRWEARAARAGGVGSSLVGGPRVPKNACNGRPESAKVAKHA